MDDKPEEVKCTICGIAFVEGDIAVQVEKGTFLAELGEVDSSETIAHYHERCAPVIPTDE